MNQSTMIRVKNFFAPEDFNKMGITLIADRSYIVPEYQRAIRWESENAKILIDDVRSDNKFLGTVFISSQDGSKEYNLIDGQQRVTILFMIYWAYSIDNPEVKKYICCKYYNESFRYLKELCMSDFNLQSIFCEGKQITEETIKESDVLDQFDKYKDLWRTIRDTIVSLTPRQSEEFFKNITNSEINLICNIQDKHNTDNQICVNYFLDINDRAISLDEVDIFKGYLFKMDFENMTTRWGQLQRNLRKLQEKGVFYPILSLLEHYILCDVNSKLNYKIKRLQHFKITQDIEISGDKYKAGRHILEVVKKPEYGKNLMDNLDSFIGFLILVLDGNNGNTSIFDTYFKVTSGKTVDSDTRNNCICLIRRIILNDNVVPKLLVMKFFYERLLSNDCKKNDYKDIYYVYLCSIMFILSDTNKASASFGRIVLAENWKSELENKAIKYLKRTVWNGRYDRRVEKKDVKPEEGGKFLPIDVACIYEFFELAENDQLKKIDEKKLYKFLTDSTMSSEHLFINKSFTYLVKFGDSETTIDCPKRLRRYVSFTGNYLYMKEEPNREIGNAPIWEKIRYYDQYKNKEKTLGCKFADIQFDLIKECFSDLPDLTYVSDENKAREAFHQYYNSFETRYKLYLERLKGKKGSPISIK